MAGVKYHSRGNSEKVNVLELQLEEFKAMRIHVNDMVSDKFFDHGIITYEDRVMLRKLLQEINDIIQDLEIVPYESVVSNYSISKRKVDTVDRYRNVVYAFDNNNSITAALNEDDMYKSSAVLSSDSSETENDDYCNRDEKEQPQWKINYGYDGDERYKENKDIKGNKFVYGRNDPRTGNENVCIKSFSSTSSDISDKVIAPRETTDHNRNNVGYYGDTKYFVEDREETRIIDVVGEDNWTLRNPNHVPPLNLSTKYIVNDGEKSGQPSDDISSSGNLRNKTDDYRMNIDISHFVQEGSATENTSDVNTDDFRHRFDDVDNDYDDVAVVAGTAADNFEIHNDDITDALEGFDYLDEMDETNDDGVNDALSGFNYLDDLDENHEDGIKDALGNFDYLDDLDEHSSTNSSIELQTIPRDKSHVNGHTQAINDLDNEEHVYEINAYENGLRRKPGDVSHFLNDTPENTTHVNKRIFDEDTLEFQNHHVQTFDEATLENKGEFKKSNQLYKNEYKAYQKAREVKDADVQMLPVIHRSNVYNKMDERIPGLIERTRSEEKVSSFTSGEFILRRTRSEDIQYPNPTITHKTRMDLEPLPEDRYSAYTESESMEYGEKGSSGTVHCNICSFILKALLVLLFGIAATKITLGVVFRDSCQVEEIVPVCVIASGAVSLCYCFILFGVHFFRKRSNRISRPFRTFLVFMWVIFLGLIIAGCVLLYPSIQEYAFKDCSVEEECCSRKLTLTAFGAIITDLISLLGFLMILCCVK